MSAQMKSYKLDWDTAAGRIRSADSGKSLQSWFRKLFRSSLGKKSSCNVWSLYIISVLRPKVLILQLRIRGVLHTELEAQYTSSAPERDSEPILGMDSGHCLFRWGTPSNMDLAMLARVLAAIPGIALG